MKVAWLFTGLPRDPEYGSEWFLHLIKCYDSTVVAHFWSCNEKGLIDCHKRERIISSNGKPWSRLVPDTHLGAITDFNRIYSPSRTLVEPCSKAIATSPHDSNIYIRAYFAQISAQRALSLINPTDFDIIVKCRTDVLVYKKEVPTLDTTKRGNEGLYTICDFFDPAINVNDTVLYGHPKVMVPIINSVDMFWQIEKKLARNVHATLAYHSKRLGIPVVNIGGPKSGKKIRL